MHACLSQTKYLLYLNLQSSMSSTYHMTVCLLELWRYLLVWRVCHHFQWSWWLGDTIFTWCPFINKELTCPRSSTIITTLLPFLFRRVLSSCDMCYDRSQPFVTSFLGSTTHQYLGKSLGPGGSHRLASRRHRGFLHADISRRKDLIEKARKTITKLEIGTPTLVKATGSTQQQ